MRRLLLLMVLMISISRGTQAAPPLVDHGVSDTVLSDPGDTVRSSGF